MQLIINAPEDLTQNLKLLKPQGFLFLSLIQKEFKNNLIDLNVKKFAEKFELAVSTVRRWIKKLVALGFIKLPPDLQSLDPIPQVKKVINKPATDPLEYFLDTLSIPEATMMRIMMRQKGVELNTHDKPLLKQTMLSKPEYLEGLMEFYNARIERTKHKQDYHPENS